MNSFRTSRNELSCASRSSSAWRDANGSEIVSRLSAIWTWSMLRPSMRRLRRAAIEESDSGQPVTRAQLGRGMVSLRLRAHGVSDFSHCSLQRLNPLHELRDHDSC